MVILLVKIVSAIVYPAGLAFFLLAGGMGLWRWGRSDRWQVWGKRTAVAGLAVFYCFSNGLVAEQLARSLERREMLPDPLPQADGVIVLGGGISPRAYPRQTAEVHDAGDHLFARQGPGDEEHPAVLAAHALAGGAHPVDFEFEALVDSQGSTFHRGDG